MKILFANRIVPDGTPRSAASHLGQFSLSMSHKKDARRKRVKGQNLSPVGLDSIRSLTLSNYAIVLVIKQNE